ncbi:MAG: GLPGLI family protein [Bacteroidetes bacterium]|nr:GLPGLI family protein [Bacteroidota bacterium]
MKKILLLALAIAAITHASAQAPDEAVLTIHYKFAHIRDTNNRDHPYTENMVLLVGKRSGVYKSAENRVQEQTSTNPDGTTRTDVHHFGTVAEYYQYPNEKRLLRKDKILFSDFLITDALPTIDWRISNDTATLGGLHCQKATTHFKGRDYIAWFCPELPLHIGPWKLNGLPGVIVEAHDTKNEVRFTFDGIDKTASEPILPPDKGVKTTDKEYTRLQETAHKDPQAFLDGMTSHDGGPARKMKIDVKPGPGPVMNNPIELPETK